MTAADPVAALLADLEAAVGRLATTIEGIDEEALRRPSLLPGWSRAHVLSHLARNGDGMRNLLLAARTGAAVYMYASGAVRNADIEAGAGRDAEVIALDALVSAERFLVEGRAMPDDAWAATIRTMPAAPPMTATEVVSRRLNEVETHHVDLGMAYTFADSPLAGRFMDALAVRSATAGVGPFTLSATDQQRSWDIGTGTGVTVEGPTARLLLWALGRGSGEGLTSGSAELPPPPDWG